MTVEVTSFREEWLEILALLEGFDFSIDLTGRGLDDGALVAIRGEMKCKFLQSSPKGEEAFGQHIQT